MAEINVEQAKPKEFKGLSDGGRTVVRCSLCNAPLIEVWVTRPEADETWNLVAECCHCGDKSFVYSVTGGFHIGHGTENDVIYSVINNQKVVGDKMVVKTVKMREWQNG